MFAVLPAANELVGLLHIGPLQADDDRFLHADVLRGVDDTRRDDVTPHDPAEDVHQDSRHLPKDRDKYKIAQKKRQHASIGEGVRGERNRPPKVKNG